MDGSFVTVSSTGLVLAGELKSSILPQNNEVK
jgi:hypothetical protein